MSKLTRFFSTSDCQMCYFYHKWQIYQISSIQKVLLIFCSPSNRTPHFDLHSLPLVCCSWSSKWFYRAHPAPVGRNSQPDAENVDQNEEDAWRRNWGWAGPSVPPILNHVIPLSQSKGVLFRKEEERGIDGRSKWGGRLEEEIGEEQGY